MRFFVHSGTDIQPFVERYDSAALALEAVSALLAQQLPNVRVLDEEGHGVSIDALRQLAVEENESDDA